MEILSLVCYIGLMQLLNARRTPVNTWHLFLGFSERERSLSFILLLFWVSTGNEFTNRALSLNLFDWNIDSRKNLNKKNHTTVWMSLIFPIKNCGEIWTDRHSWIDSVTQIPTKIYYTFYSWGSWGLTLLLFSLVVKCKMGGQCAQLQTYSICLWMTSRHVANQNKRTWPILFLDRSHQESCNGACAALKILVYTLTSRTQMGLCPGIARDQSKNGPFTFEGVGTARNRF